MSNSVSPSLKRGGGRADSAPSKSANVILFLWVFVRWLILHYTIAMLTG